MDISKLHEGQTVKNYVELCSLLGKQPTTGSGRKALFKELARYCDYTVSGRVFTINRIYKMPKEKIKTNAKWLDAIGLSILYKIAQQPRNPEKQVTEVYIETYNLALYVGLCDAWFYSTRSLHNNLPYKDKKTNFPVQEDFYKTATLKFSSILDGVKKNLKDRKLIHFEKTWRYDKIGGDKDIEADLDMRTYIAEAQGRALRETPYRSMQAVVRSHHFIDYRKAFVRILKEEHGIINAKEYTRFSFTDEVEDRIRELCREIDQNQEALKANKLIVDFLEKRKVAFISEREKEGFYNYSSRDLKENRVITPTEQKEAHLELYQHLIEEYIKLYDDSEEQTNSQPGE